MHPNAPAPPPPAGPATRQLVKIASGTPLGPRSLDAVGRLVAALGGQGLQLLCLNKVVVDDEERWLQVMATALETAGAAPSSVRPNWPCLELSQVRLRFSLPVCARARLWVCMRACVCMRARGCVCACLRICLRLITSLRDHISLSPRACACACACARVCGSKDLLLPWQD